MSKVFTIERDGLSFCLATSKGKRSVAWVKINEWETAFFKRRFGILTVDRSVMSSLGRNVVGEALDSLLLCAARAEYDVIEMHLDVTGIEIVPILEDKGFRLVDTMITFITLIDKKVLEKYSWDLGTVGFVTRSDLEDVLRLTYESLTKNAAFFSRFKNRSYFTEKESERYFAAWIRNHIEDDDSLFAGMKRENKTVGYFIYKRAGRYEGKQLYKGILTAVDPEYRGHSAHLAMQSFLYEHFPEEEFYVDNTTQLTNFAALKSHIKSKKSLNRIQLAFFWARTC